jgi:hypothetical protein
VDIQGKATPLRRRINAIATVLAVALLIGVAHGAAALVVAAVVIAAAASAIASPSWAAAAGNFVVGVGVFGVIAMLLANDGVPTGDARNLFAVLVAIPVATLAASAVYAARKVTGDPALEFESHVLERAAGIAFVVTLVAAATLTIVDAVSAVPNPPPVVYLVVCVNSFVLALITERRRLS